LEKVEGAASLRSVQVERAREREEMLKAERAKVEAENLETGRGKGEGKGGALTN